MYSLILKNTARFISLTPEEEAYFISLLQEKTLRKKEYLVQEGALCHHTYFVNKGALRTYFVDAKGFEHNMQFAIEDWWAGDMHSVLKEKPSRFNIVAVEDTELLSLEKQDQEKLFKQVPKFERFFRHLLQNAFVAFQDRILAGMSETAEERYLNFRKKYAAMESRFPQNQIASFLGITPESLSRIRKQLAKRKANY